MIRFFIGWAVLSFSFSLYAQETIEVLGQRLPYDKAAESWQPPAGGAIATGEDLWQEMVNFNFSGGSNRPRFFQIRGVGDHSQFEDLKQSPVGFFYEGIDLSEEASTFKYLPGFQTRILYHPQPVLAGSKGLGGLIAIQSGVDTIKDSPSVGALLGSQRQVGGQVYLPVETESRGRYISGLIYNQSDGFISNEYLRRKTAKREEWNLFLSGHQDLGRWQFENHHLFAYQNNGYDHWNRTFDFRSQADRPGKDFHRVHGHSFKFYSDFEAFRLQSLTSYTGTLHFESFDEDWGNDEFWLSLPDWNAPYNYFSEYRRNRKKFHQTFSLLNWSGWDFNLHAYVFEEEQKISAFKDQDLRRSSQPKITTRALALSFSKELQSTARSQWTWGHRLEKQWLSAFEGSENQGAAEDLLWAGSLHWRFLVNPNFQSDWQLTRAFRGGGFNTNADFADDKRRFGPEDLVSLEWKGRLYKNHRLQVFHNWRTNQQVKVSEQDDPIDPSSYTFFTDSAASTKAYGLESFSNYSFGARWDLQMSLGFLKTEFGNFQLAGVDLGGRSLADAPETSFNLRVDYRPSENWNLYVGASGKGRRYFSNSHNQQARAYELFRVGAEWKRGSWTAKAWVKNLLDRKYAIRGFFFANDPPEWQETLYQQRGAPRTLGLQIQKRF